MPLLPGNTLLYILPLIILLPYLWQTYSLIQKERKLENIPMKDDNYLKRINIRVSELETVLDTEFLDEEEEGQALGQALKNLQEVFHSSKLNLQGQEGEETND